MEQEHKENKLLERFKTFIPQNWIVIGLEFIFSIILIIFTVNFLINLANGVSFLGDGNHAYEIGISIFMLILSVIMLVILAFDLFFHDFEKERKSVTRKSIHDGRVIENKVADIEDDTKAKK